MNKYGNKITFLVLLGISLFTAGITLGQTNIPIQGSSQEASTSPNNGPGVVNPAYVTRVLKWKHLTDAARKALRAEDYVAAEDFARQALNQVVGQDLSLDLLVEAMHAQGEDMEALPYYQKISESGETSPGYELSYALLLLKTGHWSQAVTIYNKTLPFLFDADLLKAQNNFSPTVKRTKDLETAIHIGLGIHYLHHSSWAGRPQDDEGLLNIRQAIALAPSSALAHYQYGVGLAKTSRTALGMAQARAAFQKAATLDHGEVKAAAEKAISGR